MLSEVSKTILRGVVQGMQSVGYQDDLMHDGPANIVSSGITRCVHKGCHDLASHFEENRDEAEQYVAGLLGMM